MQQTDIDSKDTKTESKTNRKVDLRLALISAVLFVVSGAMLNASLGAYLKGAMALQYKSTDAKVVSVEQKFDAFGVSKIAKMRYWINGAEKTAETVIPAGRVMKPGELTVLYYDKGNTENAVLSQEIDYDPIIPTGAFGLLLFSFAVFIGFKSKK